VGTFAEFRQGMVQAIPRIGQDLAGELGLSARPLTTWTARSQDDYGIALMELWALVADVLTFYQERIANESYLGTALQLDSIRRLAAILDYRLSAGVAAGTHLSYVLEPRTALSIPAGLRAQSVPKQGQKPQTFEPVEAFEARSELNEVRVFVDPQTEDVLASAGTGGALAPGSYVPAPGDRLLLFEPGGALAPEIKVVSSVETVDERPVVRWTPPVQQSGFSDATSFVRPYGRTFRPFGADAPSSYVKPTTDASGLVTWSIVQEGTSYDFDLTAGWTLALDGVYEDLKVGTRVILVSPGITITAQITETEQQSQTHGPLTASVTVLTLSFSVPAVDRRTVTVYELLDDKLVFPGWTTGSTLAAGDSTVFAPIEHVPSLEADRWIVIDDAAGEPQAVKTVSPGDPVDMDGDGVPELLSISFDPPAARAMDGTTLVMRGNVTRATHGETVKRETLGNGDSSVPFQAFAVAKKPVTRVQSASAPGGALDTLSVLVDGVQWQEVQSLYGQDPRGRVYTTRVDDQGTLTVGFGDGETGSRLPTGVKNVVAGYRHGLGREGNLDAGAIRTPLDRPVGLKSVSNPLPATGGVDPERTDEARLNAPSTVRTFDRAISLRDFEDLAVTFTGVAKALATSVWDGEVQVVHLTLAGPDGTRLSPEELKTLRAYLDQRRDPNRPLRIDQFTPVGIQVAATVQADPTHVNEVVAASAMDALAGLFAFDARRFGQPVHLSDVYAAVQSAPGVVSADVDLLGYRDPAVAGTHDATSDPVQPHLRIDAARPNASPPPAVLPAELAVALHPADLSIAASGGLPS
jgi:hypothetical protein